jgi:hypothetical protein
VTVSLFWKIHQKTENASHSPNASKKAKTVDCCDLPGLAQRVLFLTQNGQATIHL